MDGAGRAYLNEVTRRLGEIRDNQGPEIRRAAGLVADAVSAGGLLHVFGTGHSHLLAEEVFFRAGCLAQVNPILLDAPVLNAGAAHSTRLERLASLVSALFDDEPVDRPDVVIIVSNSGDNPACVKIALEAARRGIGTVGVTSARHAVARDARRSGGPRLPEVVDVALDNRGSPGDACLTIDGLEQPIGPTSTAIGAALLHAVMAQAVENLVARGHNPALFASSNMVGGDVTNSDLVARYSPRVRAL